MKTLSEGPTRWAKDGLKARLDYDKYRGNGVRDAKGDRKPCPASCIFRTPHEMGGKKVCKGCRDKSRKGKR